MDGTQDKSWEVNIHTSTQVLYTNKKKQHTGWSAHIRSYRTKDIINKEMIGLQTTHETDDKKLTCRTDCIWNNKTTNE